MEETILVVDDESWIRRNLKRVLESEGYKVLLADSGKNALIVMEEKIPDLIISDQRMPRMSGLEFLEQVRNIYPNVFRVMLTGFPDLQLALGAINKVGIHRLLLKPYSKKQIIDVVSELLALRQHGALASSEGMDQAKCRKRALDELREDHPDIDQVKRDTCGRIVISEEELSFAREMWPDLDEILEPCPGTKKQDSQHYYPERYVKTS